MAAGRNRMEQEKRHVAHQRGRGSSANGNKLVRKVGVIGAEELAKGM